VLEGNPGKRPLPEGEPKPSPIVPRCPGDIDKEAKRIWRQLAPKLERLGLLTEVDGHAFAILCQIRSRLVKIHKFNAQFDSLVQEKVMVDGSGQEHSEAKASPYTVMEKQYYDLFRKYAGEFGLSPRGRVGLVVGSSDKGTDLF